MRDSISATGFSSHEVSPLIPDPPVQQPRVKQRSNFCHRCWSNFTCCSKWTCIFISIMMIIAILIIVRTLLPFGWPWWVPDIEYDASDPHIILIVADDIGWGDLGYGGAEFPTTNIDQLRQSGISLNRMYAHQSGSGTRASLLTGIPAYSLGLQDGIDTGSSAHIPLSTPTLPELLKSERGYATHMVGKWALGYSKWAYTPTHRGFDTFLGFHQRYIDYWHYSASIQAERVTSDPLFTHNELLMGYDLWKNDKVFSPSSRLQYATEIFDDQLDSILNAHLSSSHPDQPMFLYYTPPNAHAPIQYHYEYEGECSYIKETSETIRWKYCNLMQELDMSVGKLVDKLKATGMWERSVLLFTTDNGGLMCYDVGSVNSCSGSVNLPLRGGKGTLFEGSIRVRSVLSGGYLDANVYGESSEELMHSADVFATLLEAANVDVEGVLGLGSEVDEEDAMEDDVPPRVIGLSFWDYLNRGAAAPVRDLPFIADMAVDETGSYIEKAAIFWKGFKYIIQPIELYDGWWRSPLGGSEEIPSDSEGVEMSPQPLQSHDGGRKVGADVLLEGVEGIGEVDEGWSGIRMNEYLFSIEEDPAETENVRMDARFEDVLAELRGFLQGLGGATRLYETQDSSTSVHANPNNFASVWYPFEEDF